MDEPRFRGVRGDLRKAPCIEGILMDFDGLWLEIYEEIWGHVGGCLKSPFEAFHSKQSPT